MTTETLDQDKLDEDKMEAFGEKLMAVLNGASLAMMTSIGHRTGLFDVLAEMAPTTSNELAVKSRLQERYVREWLGAMVTGQIVEYDAATRRYSLPPEHAGLLTRAAAQDNMAATMQWISVLGSVEDKIVDCFKNGGGVPYSAYARFHEVMAQESAQTVVAGLTEHILPLVPGLIERLEQGIDVLDIGCGSARAVNFLARTFPNSRFVGYDISEEAIQSGRREAEENGTKNVRLDVRDVSQIGDRAAFDLITAFDAIHDQAAPDRVLGGIAAALRDDGTFLMQDIRGHSHVQDNKDHPIGTFIYTISCMHCMTVSLSAGGMGLGAMWGRETAHYMLADAGFYNVEMKELSHDFINDYYIVKKT